jgi:hypothetical protein
MGDNVGYETVFTVDENGGPIVAWAESDANGDHTIYLQHWDACGGAWGPKLKVDGVFAQSTNDADETTSRNVSVAYDHSNGTIGVAYQTWNTTDNSYTIRYAELPKGASAVSAPEMVAQSKDQTDWLFQPALAMANGKAHIFFQESWVFPTGTSGLEYTARTGGTWSTPMTVEGSVCSHSEYPPASAAVDSAGNPAVAFLGEPDADYTEYVRYWRPGMAAAVIVMKGTQSDEASVGFTFEGLKPRIVASVNHVPDAGTIWYIASDDGMTWGTPSAIPNDGGSSLGAWVAIATHATAGTAITATELGSDGTDVCGEPKISTATTPPTFTTCGPAKTVSNGATTHGGAAFGPDGKLQMAYRQVATDPQTNLASGVIYYRQP